MVTRTYDGTTSTDVYASESATDGRRYRDVGATIFLWIAWTLAFAFWAFAMSSFFGILRAIGDHPALISGAIDTGGAAYVLMDVIGGVVVLGLVMAYAAERWATRDKSLDPMTEAATARLYDEGATRPRA